MAAAAKKAGKALAEDFGFVWRCFAWSWRRRWKLVFGLTLAVFVGSGLLLFPNDLKLLQWVQLPQGLGKLEKFLEFWGDFLQFNVAVTLILLVAGYLRKDRWMRRLALAFLLGGVLSGVTARAVKFSSGRARPKEIEKQVKRGNLETEGMFWVRFTGPNPESKYHGYFSGHSAATWGSAVVLLIVMPQVGWIAVLYAGAVALARIYGNEHYPSDVIHGVAWGIAWGYLVGNGLSRVKKRARLLKAEGANGGGCQSWGKGCK